MCTRALDGAGLPINLGPWPIEFLNFEYVKDSKLILGIFYISVINIIINRKLFILLILHNTTHHLMTLFFFSPKDLFNST